MFEIFPNWHPIFVHFTVALLSLAVGLSVVTRVVGFTLREQWQIVSRWALWFGAAFMIVSGLTGLQAYGSSSHDAPSHLAMTDRRNRAAVTVALFSTLTAWSVISVRKH